MKRIVYITLFMILAVACNEKLVEKPEDLISREKMVDILYDLSLINAGKAINPKVLQENQIESMDYIYRKYDVDSAQFMSSDLYYASLPLEYEAIYRALEDRIEQQKKRIEEERTKQSDSARQRTINRTLPKDSIMD